MKKIISALLSVVMMMSVFSAGAYAAVPTPNDDGKMPMYDSGDIIRSTLTIKNKVAECKSSIMLYSGEKWVKITQTLEKQTSSGTWSQTSNTWTKNSDGDSTICTFINSANLSESGKYRVKSVVIIESSNGKQETVTKYSSTISA